MGWYWHERSYEEMVLPFHNAFLLHIQKLPMKREKCSN